MLRERLDGLLADQKRIADVISERTGLSSENVEEFFREASTKDAAYAASVGIVDEVRDVKIPPGSLIGNRGYRLRQAISPFLGLDEPIC